MDAHINLPLTSQNRLCISFSEMTEYKVDDTELDDPVLLLRIQDVKAGGVWMQSLPVYVRLV